MKSPLARIFSSKTRIKILTLFLRNPGESFYVRELTRKLKERINSVRRELDNLSKMGLLKSTTKDFKKFYRVDPNFHFLDELRALFLKATAAPKEKMAEQLNKLGQVDYACLSGTFTRSPSKVDLFIVGKVSKDKMTGFIKKLEKEQEQEINYTIMDKSEFNYRKELGDNFISTVLDNEKVDLIDKL